jgi:signal transduction histidine kinase
MPTTKIDLPTQIDLEGFISTQAHDMRTPFNHIVGFSKMTLNTLSDAPLTDYQKEDIGTIYRSGMRALTILNGLIDIARIKRKEKDVSPSDVNLEQLISQSLAQWKKFNPGTTTQTQYYLPSESTIVHVDDQIVKQIVVGFISYVGQYCEANTQVTIQVAEEPNWFVFTLKSTGVKSKVLSELDLEMLGFVNRALVELHKGEIRLVEENDEGAIVQFTLPKFQASEESQV